MFRHKGKGKVTPLSLAKVGKSRATAALRGGWMWRERNIDSHLLDENAVWKICPQGVNTLKVSDSIVGLGCASSHWGRRGETCHWDGSLTSIKGVHVARQVNSLKLRGAGPCLVILGDDVNVAFTYLTISSLQQISTPRTRRAAPYVSH